MIVVQKIKNKAVIIFTTAFYIFLTISIISIFINRDEPAQHVIFSGAYMSDAAMQNLEYRESVEIKDLILNGTVLSYRLVNNTDYSYAYSHQLSLYFREGDRWKHIRFLPGQGAFVSMAFDLPPNSYVNQEVHLYNNFGALPSGAYRIIR